MRVSLYWVVSSILPLLVENRDFFEPFFRGLLKGRVMIQRGNNYKSGMDRRNIQSARRQFLKLLSSLSYFLGRAKQVP